MNREKRVSFLNLFKLPGFLFVASVSGIVLTSLGQGEAAIGLLIGVSLYILNLAFLYEGGKSLLSAGTKRTGRAVAAVSSVGRLLFLGVALSFVLRLGLVAFIAACGGLLAGQVNLHLSLLIQGRIN
jgi:hypothetical protein